MNLCASTHDRHFASSAPSTANLFRSIFEDPVQGGPKLRDELVRRLHALHPSWRRRALQAGEQCLQERDARGERGLLVKLQ